jgi:hypothetical protein
MYLSNFPITRHIECTWNQTLQEYNFIPGVGNFAQEFAHFFCKNVKSPPLARSPPPPPSGLTLIGALFYVVQCQHWRPFKYDENVKQSHQLDSEAQQMHSINKWDIFFTYVVNIFWISISLLNIITAKFPLHHKPFASYYDTIFSNKISRRVYTPLINKSHHWNPHKITFRTGSSAVRALHKPKQSYIYSPLGQRF